MLNDLLHRLRSLVRRCAAEVELDDELRFHREQQLEKYLNSGLGEKEARRRLRMEFGGLDEVKEECRDARGARPAEALFQDVRYGLRVLRKSPGFTAVAMLTFALGIGATTAIFSVLYGVLLRPLPYQDASRLIVLNETTPKAGTVSVSYLNFQDWRAQSHAFSKMAAVHSVEFNLSGVNEPQNISGEAVSPNFLSLLGLHPFLGRDFEPAEDAAGTPPVVLISYPLWQSHFGASPAAVGRTVALNGHGYTVAGVLPPDFRWFEKTDVLEPVGVWKTGNSAWQERGERGDSVVIGRLAPGFGLPQARVEMEGIASRLAQAYPGSNDQFGVALQPVRDVFVGDIRLAVVVLFAGVTFVLLIACANVASLFLMRGASRVREIALRVAIGATRGRIVAQMLAESFVLAAFGGLAGLALAAAAIHAIRGLIPADMLAGASIDLNSPSLLFTAAVVTLSALVFGLAPALASAKTDVQSELKEGGRTTSVGTGPSRWRGVLVVAEVSLAMVLLIGAGLMMKSLYRLLSVDPGIRTERVLTMQLSLRTAQYDKKPAILNFWDRVLSGVRALPGVRAAAVGTGVPLTGDHSRSDITVEGMPPTKPGNFPHPDDHIVSPEYVRALGLRLQRGRTFSDTDNENAPLVGMINARLAREYFAGRDPIGQRFMFGHPSADTPRWITIVGVAGDTKLYGLANPSRLEVYLPLRQNARDSMTLLVKTANDPAALTSAIRGVISSIDKDQPVAGVATMAQLLTDSVSTRRITFFVLGSFSALALLLAAIGIYGVISYSVAQRGHEIGIRIALGARPADVLRMVIAQGARIAATGALIGIAASLFLTRWMTSLLFSVSSADPATFAGVTAALLFIAMLACYIPARRTLRVDPVRALRCE